MRRHDRSQVASEVALWLVTVAAVIGMHRLFVDGSYRPPLVLDAVLAHAAAALLRRLRVRLVPAAVAVAGLGVLALTWMHYASTTTALLPTSRTWAALGTDLDEAVRLIQDVKAPAPVATGFLVMIGAAVWILAFVADWAAFRASATFEALLPAGILFVFTAFLAGPGGWVAGATVFAAAAMGFVLLRRILAQEERSTWAASHRSRGRWSLLGTGASLIVGTLLFGAVIGPNLPGANADPLLPLHDLGDNDQVRRVQSPLVDLQTRIVRQPNIELFTVRADEASYWRLTSLDVFDGRVWRSSYGTNDADGSLPQAVESDVEASMVQQTFSISNLAAVWVPAAWEPVSIDPDGYEIDWDEDSSTLIVDKDLDTSDGLSYTVESRIPRWTEQELRTASSNIPGDIAGRYLELPRINSRVRNLALEVTADADTPYGKAMALQDYLRGPDFTYNKEAPRGHSSDALMTFLFDTHEGYCEQFAGSYAVMARLIGLPSRVSVGFTPGIQDEDDPSLYHVRGEHAHAWVEVYLDGFGWVIVDPTPGRAPPGARDWLDVPPQQDVNTGNGTVAATIPPSESRRPDRGSGGVTTGDGGQISADRNQTGNGAFGGSGTSNRGIGEAVRTTGRGIGVAALAYLLVVPAAIAVQQVLRRQRIRRRSGGPVDRVRKALGAPKPAEERARDRVRLAWQDSIDRAATGGTPMPPSLTIAETVERLAGTFPQAAAAAHDLGATIELLAYAEVDPSPEQVEAAAAARDAIVGETARHQPLGARLRRYVDARELWRRRRQRKRRTARTGTTPVTVG